MKKHFMEKNIIYYTSVRPEIVSLVPENIKTVLDIGCGEGGFLKAVKNKTKAETWGVEMMSELEDVAKANTDHFLSGKIEDVLTDLPDNYFDCITLNDVLEHLIEPTDVLKLIKPKLSPKGVLIASIPNVRFVSNLRRLLIQKDWQYCESGILDSTHLRFFTQKSMKRMFEDAGYEVLYQKGLNKDKSLKFRIMNVLTCYFFNDARYVRFANVTKRK